MKRFFTIFAMLITLNMSGQMIASAKTNVDGTYKIFVKKQFGDFEFGGYTKFNTDEEWKEIGKISSYRVHLDKDSKYEGLLNLTLASRIYGEDENHSHLVVGTSFKMRFYLYKDIGIEASYGVKMVAGSNTETHFFTGFFHVL